MKKTIKLKYSSFQKRFLSLSDEPLLILTTGVGAGKSRVAAMWVVFEAIKKKTRMIAAAQNYRALTEVLFREIESLLLTMDITYKYTKGQKFTLENGSEIFGATAQNPTSILGFTDIEYAIIDEAAYCPEELYNYITDRMRGENVKQGKVRLISSPSNTIQAQWFKKLCSKYPSKVIHATTFDNPFTGKEYKQAQKDKYGEGTPMYRQQLLGEFIDDDLNFAIIGAKEFPTLKQESYGERWMGIDCAGSGADYTVFVVVDKTCILDKVKIEKADTFKLHTIGKELVDKWNVRKVNIDVTGGFGNGLMDMLKLSCPNINVVGINFAQKAIEDCYANSRAEMYFELSKKIKEGFYIADDEIKEELLNTTYLINGTGKTMLVKKSDIKEIIGRSPDTADALALALYENIEELSPAESKTIAMGFV
jgi:hypothetical protein